MVHSNGTQCRVRKARDNDLGDSKKGLKEHFLPKSLVRVSKMVDRQRSDIVATSKGGENVQQTSRYACQGMHRAQDSPKKVSTLQQEESEYNNGCKEEYQQLK